jgi:inorganic pyrophosphatase
MYMEDEAGIDAKIIAVPHSKLTPLYNNVKDLNDLPQLQLEQMKHFFEHYKDLEEGKWMKFNGWGNVEEARTEILKSIQAYK